MEIPQESCFNSVKYNLEMPRLIIRHVLAFIILAGSLIFLVWGNFPPSEETQELRVPGLGQQQLVWTSRIRAGETGIIKLEFDSAELGISGISASGAETIKFGSVRQFPLQSAEHIQIETRVELPGALIQPGEELIQSLKPGEKTTFKWLITPHKSGVIDGEIWVYLKMFSEVQGDDIRHPVSITSIHTQSIDLLGVTGQTSRIFGIIGICIAPILWRDLITDFAFRLLNRQRNP